MKYETFKCDLCHHEVKLVGEGNYTPRHSVAFKSSAEFGLSESYGDVCLKCAMAIIKAWNDAVGARIDMQGAA